MGQLEFCANNSVNLQLSLPLECALIFSRPRKEKKLWYRSWFHLLINSCSYLEYPRTSFRAVLLELGTLLPGDGLQPAFVVHFG